MGLKNNNFKKQLPDPQNSGKILIADYIFIIFSSVVKKQVLIEGRCLYNGEFCGNIIFGAFEINPESTTLLKDCHEKAIAILGDGFEIVDLKQ